jgi:hypothetical protein
MVGGAGGDATRYNPSTTAAAIAISRLINPRLEAVSEEARIERGSNRW